MFVCVHSVCQCDNQRVNKDTEDKLMEIIAEKQNGEKGKAVKFCNEIDKLFMNLHSLDVEAE